MACFLDTSAVAKLYHEEMGSAFMEQLLLRADETAFISRLGVLEMHSVLAGKARICLDVPTAVCRHRVSYDPCYHTASDQCTGDLKFCGW